MYHWPILISGKGGREQKLSRGFMYSDNGHPHPPTTFPQRPMTHPVAATKFWATTPSVYVCVIAKKEIICALRLSLRYIDGKTSCVKGCVNSMLPFSCFLILHRKRWKRMSLATSDTTILNIRVSQSIGPSSRSASCCSFLLLFVLLPDKTRNISLSISSRLQMLHARGRNEISSTMGPAYKVSVGTS